MPTILHRAEREGLLLRLRSLTPDRKPVSGSLSAHRMICHLGDQIAVALGDIPGRSEGTLLSRTLLKWLAVYAPIRMPLGKIKTVPEMLTTSPTDWTKDLARLESLLMRLVEADRVSPHPAFGPLSHRAWGIVTAKHLDHHLRQFGA
jgi:hypothetical protein